jgi:hypothetical protein
VSAALGKVSSNDMSLRSARFKKSVTR